MFSIRRILVPVDFSPCSRAALDYAVDLATVFSAEVEVLHVWEPPLYLSPEMLVNVAGRPPISLSEFAQTAAGRQMDELLASVEKRGVRVHGRLAYGVTTETILHSAAEDCDLVVMGTHGRTGFAHLVLGSVAERVVRHAACPVLTIHSLATAAVEAEAQSSAAVRRTTDVL
jgi:nucleotide-binding universal stress UspA family protein